MVNSYSCLRLDIGRVIPVEVYEDNDNNKQKFFEIGNDKKVPFDKLIVAQLAELIACKGNFKVSNLWKVDVDKCKLNPGSTKEDIEKLGGESMEFEYDFIKYFQDPQEIKSTLLLPPLVSVSQRFFLSFSILHCMVYCRLTCLLANTFEYSKPYNNYNN
jgi:hypothetical protein